MTAVMSRLRRPRLVTDYAIDLRLFPTYASKSAIAVLVLLWAVLPGVLPTATRDFWLGVLVRVGIFAIGAIGLNLLTGYTGQVSLGHAFFMAVGAYTWAHFAGEQGLPLLVWLPLAAIIGGVVGGIIGPFALRLRGTYLAIVSLGLIFIGLHIWHNWESVTGGAQGYSGGRDAVVGPLNFGALELFGRRYSVQEGYFWLVWFFVGLSALIAKNIVRTRPGRAMQAVRDRDVAAEVIGVDVARYKVAAFAVSSAFAAVAGSLYGAYSGYVHPEEWNLFLAIQFIAVIIVGGVATVFGAVLGALFVAGGPEVISRYASEIPGVSWLTQQGGMSIDTFNQMLYGLVIVFFLVVEPHGLAGIWLRIKAYFRAWPFSY